MGLFRRKREAEEPMTVTDAEVKAAVPELQQNVPAKNKRREIEHYIVAQCETIMETTKTLEECKGEYRIVTDYLSDIQILEELPEEERAEIKEAAMNVTKLNHVRDDYRNANKKLSDAQFSQMQQLEEELPDEIRRLKSNESYQAAVKRDMQYLEGEKSELAIRNEEIREEQENIQKILFCLLGISVLAFSLIFILQFGFRMDCEMALMLVVFVVAVLTLGLFLKRQYNITELHRTEINRNHAITMENKMKIKYVNITNAVDYACEKYHVRNSYELNYQWEQYMEMVKEKQKYLKTSEELDYYNQKLVKLLHHYHLYDDKIWLTQADALLDEKEMVEIKHDLFVRRKKLRDQLDYNLALIHKAQREVDYLSSRMKKCAPNIQEIVNSVDHLCEGL